MADKTKLFREIAEKKSHIQGFNACLNYIATAPVSGLVGCHKYLGYGYTEFVMVFKKDYLEYTYLEEDLLKIGNEFLKRFKENPNYFKEVLEKDSELIRKARESVAKVKKTDLTKLGKKELIDLYQFIWEAYASMPAISHIIESISFVLEPMIKERLEKIFKTDRHDKEFIKLFNALMQPARPSFANDEFIDLIKIIPLITSDEEALALFKNESPEVIFDKLSEEIKQKITEHREKFFYNQLNYFHAESLIETDYISELKELISSGVDVDEKIKKEEERYGNNIKKRKEIIKEHNIDAETINLINLSVDVLHWQDDRKLNILSTMYYQSLVLKEIGRRFDIAIELLKRYLPMEITLEKLENFDEGEAEARVKQMMVDMKMVGPKMEFEIFIKDDFDKFIEVYEQVLAEKKDLHGSCASTGKAMGPVKICRTKDDFIKFKEGDVLVAAMTRPEFVPIMRKAAAIVTDEGGLTCHAAIVSRELGVPCVVGTKVATKILKDGDLVEVNANHSIVRLIDRK